MKNREKSYVLSILVRTYPRSLFKSWKQKAQCMSPLKVINVVLNVEFLNVLSSGATINRRLSNEKFLTKLFTKSQEILADPLSDLSQVGARPSLIIFLTYYVFEDIVDYVSGSNVIIDWRGVQKTNFGYINPKMAERKSTPAVLSCMHATLKWEYFACNFSINETDTGLRKKTYCIYVDLLFLHSLNRVRWPAIAGLRHSMYRI